MSPGAQTSLSTPTRAAIVKHWSDISGYIEGVAAAAFDQAAQDHADLAAAERNLAEVEAPGAASEKKCETG